jgi:hypothetical protein
VLYAVRHGLLPVYAVRPDETDRDPLCQLQAWRRRCADAEQFAQLMSRHETTQLEHLEAEWGQALRYVHEYTGPVTDEALSDFLTALDRRYAPRPADDAAEEERLPA